MDLFRLLVFVTVVDRNGYSAAARQLHLAQPTISHHVSELEKAFNTELLHYQQRSVHLTAAGQEVYRPASASSSRSKISSRADKAGFGSVRASPSSKSTLWTV